MRLPSILIQDYVISFALGLRKRLDPSYPVLVGQRVPHRELPYTPPSRRRKRHRHRRASPYGYRRVRGVSMRRGSPREQTFTLDESEFRWCSGVP
jgi:hypothetical protein